MSSGAIAELVAAGGAGVVSRCGSVDSAEMVRRVRTFSDALASAGVGEGVPVGISIEPSSELYAAVLAVLHAGGTAVPLDPSYPERRLRVMTATAGLELVLCDATGAGALSHCAPEARLVRVDRSWDTLRNARPKPVEGLEGCAYLLFTSGSTGVPKGVAMPGDGIAALIDWQVCTHPVGGSARTLQFAASSFDVFFQELLSTWHEGGELVVPGASDRRDAFRLARRLTEAGVARVFLPFIALQQLAVAAASDGMHLPELRQIITAGEQLQATDPLRNLLRAHPQARLYNQYGPTETHVVTELALDADPTTWDPLPAIGSALPHVRLRLQPCDDGEPGGELVVGGACVARGYLGQPTMTDERFSIDADGVRWYRTGDRVIWRPDRTLQFLGRIDDQVKVRGFRVELGEVEAVLSSHPAVAASVAFVHETASGSRTLAAAVQPRDGRKITASDVRQHIRDRVPEHLVPLRVEIIPELPRTPSGKVDRRALPGRAGDNPDRRADRIVSLLCEALSAELRLPVTAEDALLDIGADSLVAMVVIARVREELAIELTVEELLDAPSIGDVALRGSAQRGDLV